MGALARLICSVFSERLTQFTHPIAQCVHRLGLLVDRFGQIAIAQRLFSAIHRALGLPGGQLVGNPVPEDAEITAEEMAPVIAQAQSEAAQQGISGKAVTPFLLARIFELTEGRSLETNIALVLNNARLAARIAAEMAI